MIIFLNKSWSYVKMYSLAVLFLGLTGGAAMALDKSVSHHSLGILSWTIAFLVSAAWAVSYVIEIYFKPYKIWKESETGKAIFVCVVFGLMTITLILVSIALGLH